MMSVRVGVSLVLVAVLVAGCTYAAPNAAVVPAAALEDAGWGAEDPRDLSALRGAVTVFVREYGPSDSGGLKVPGGVHVATTPDVPLVDESEFAEDQIVRLVQEQGIDLGERSKENFELADGRTVSSSVYRIEQNGGEGKLRVVPMPCKDADAFVVGVGWGATSAPPFFGDPPFETASGLLGAVVCPGK